MIDVIIVGAGTAGLSAAIYATRAGKKALVLEKENYGGQIINTLDIENYPGIKHISGYDFATNLYEQTLALGAEVKICEVLGIEINDTHKIVKTNDGFLKAKTVIIASGVKRRELMVEGSAKLKGRGVSYCATCDGAFFRNKDVVVNGGGNVALEDAEYLSNFCKQVTVVHRRQEFRAEEKLVTKIKKIKNINFELDATISALVGKEHLEKVILLKKDGSEKELIASGLFVAIGQIPNNEIFKNIISLDDSGYIIAGEDCCTNISGIFVAGDCRAKKVRQLATAAADGAVAALNAVKFCNND